jgi:hypothetical protein
MTVVARRIVATPARSASEAWAIMVNLLAADKNSDARKELESVSGLASNLIADEAFKSAAGIVYGSGPRVRLYCLYDDAAITGDNASESALAFNPTEGDWRMSLPCPADDLNWVRDDLKKKSSRITARDMDEGVEEDGDSDVRSASSNFEIDRKAFFNS